MKTWAFVIVLSIAISAVAQTRNVSFDGSTVAVKQVNVTPNADGSFTLQVCAKVETSGVAIESCETTLVNRGGNRTALTNLVTQARDFWLTRNQFLVSDGGTP